MRRPRAPEPLAVLVVAALVEVGLRTARLPRVARLAGVRLDLDSAPVTAPDLAPLPGWTRRRVRTVDRVMARWPLGDTCLRRCLVLGQRVRPLDPVLRLGVRRDEEGRFTAHSWLEVGGLPIEDGLERYEPLRSTW